MPSLQVIGPIGVMSIKLCPSHAYRLFGRVSAPAFLEFAQHEKAFQKHEYAIQA